MQYLAQLIAGAAISGASCILWLHAASAYLHAEAVKLQSLPALLPLYYRVVLSLLIKPRRLRPEGQELPVKSIDTGRIGAGSTLAAFNTISQGQPGPDMPLLFPSVLAFRLNIACMAAPSFPISVLGGVLSGYRAMQHRPIPAAEKLAFGLNLQPQLRTTAAGHTEFDISIAASLPTGETVWEDCSTFTVASRIRKKAAPPASLQSADASVWQQLAVWNLRSSLGRQFAALNGDINPIHISAWSAKLFGFRSNIAHGMLLLARTVSAVEANGDLQEYPRAVTASFKRPVFLPSRVCCRVCEPSSTAATAQPAGWPQQFSKRLFFAISQAEDGLHKDNIIGQLAWGRQAHKL